MSGTRHRPPGVPAWIRWAATVLGAALLAAAVVTVARRPDVHDAILAVRRPSAAAIAVLLGTVVVNLLLTGMMFSLLMSRHGRVGRLEMQALIAAASLLNFLPLRPGLFGRIAWHRAFNGIPARLSVEVTILGLVLTASVGGYAALALLVSRAGPPLWLVVGLPVPLLLAAAARRACRLWAVAALIRYLELGVFAVRYWAAFRLIGLPIDPGSALAFACISVAALLVPFVGNGLGIREWAVGIAAPLLTPYHVAQGLTADLVNRAAELVVVLVLGLAATSWLAHRARAHRGAAAGAAPPGSGETAGG